MLRSIAWNILIICYLSAYNTMSFTIECKTEQCRYTTINCEPNEDCFILCRGGESCFSSAINCPINGDCDINCESDTSCARTQIIAHANTHLTIHCNGINSCFDSTFDASKASTLYIKGCASANSCFDLTFYCPPNTNGQKNCFIEGNHNIGRDKEGAGTTIYAINGWNDINVNYFGTFGSFHGGKMYCGNDYSIPCDISSNDWTCANPNDYCNFNPQSIGSLSGLNASETLTHMHTTDSHSDHQEEIYAHGHDHHVGKDRGIVFGDQARIIFGCGVFIIIIFAIICCTFMHKRKKKSFYHYRKTSIPKMAVQNQSNPSIDINSNPSAPTSHSRLRTFTNDNFQLSNNATQYNNNTAFNDPRSPKYVNNINNINNSQTISMAIESLKSPKYEYKNEYKTENNQNQNQNINIEISGVESDHSDAMTPLQVEIAQVRQLLNLRKLMIQEPSPHNSDDSDIGTADTNDINQRNNARFLIKSYKNSISNEEIKIQEQTLPFPNGQGHGHVHPQHSSYTAAMDVINSWKLTEDMEDNITPTPKHEHVRQSTPSPGINAIQRHIINELANEYPPKYNENDIILESPAMHEKKMSSSYSIKSLKSHKSKSIKSIKSSNSFTASKRKKRNLTSSTFKMNDDEYTIASNASFATNKSSGTNNDVDCDSETDEMTQSESNENTTNESNENPTENTYRDYTRTNTYYEDDASQDDEEFPNAC